MRPSAWNDFAYCLLVFDDVREHITITALLFNY